MAIMLASYRHVIQQTFGEPERADLQRRQTLPGMPVMPSELARKDGRYQAAAQSFETPPPDVSD